MAAPPNNSVMSLKIKYQLKKQLALDTAAEVSTLQEELNAAIIAAQQETAEVELKRTHAQELQSIRAAVRLEERMSMRPLVRQLQNSWEAAQGEFLDGLRAHGLISPAKQTGAQVLQQASPPRSIQLSPPMLTPIHHVAQPAHDASAVSHSLSGNDGPYPSTSQGVPTTPPVQLTVGGFQTLEQDMMQLVAPLQLAAEADNNYMLEVSILLDISRI